MKIQNLFPHDSAEFVVLHAAKKEKRGKNPSLSFLGIKNPRKALALASSLAYFPINPTGYLVGAKLEKYVCSECGASRCKLWRQYQTINVTLLCALCASSNQKESVDDIDATGKRTSELGGRTDQIGWYVPAVPTEDEKGYWGYSAVPEPGVKWWKALPTLPLKEQIA